jgi:hypothetical protein
MRYVYHLIVIYLTGHLLWLLFREKKFGRLAAVALVLVLFILRLFLIE